MANETFTNTAWKKTVDYRLRLTRILAALLVLLGSMVLIGWVFDIPLLKSISVNWVSMKPNAAFLFILSAMILILWTISDQHRSIRLIVFFLVSFIFVVASITLSQDIFGFDAGIDELLIEGDSHALFTSHSGRPSPLSSVCFLLFAISMFLFMAAGAGIIAAQGVLLLIGLIAFLTFAGHLYSADQLVIITGVTTMALHTAFCFIVLMLAGLSLSSDQGLIRPLTQGGAGSKMFMRTFPFVILVLVALSWFRLWLQRMGWIDTEAGIAILVSSASIIFAIIFYVNAIVANRAEQELNSIQENLRHVFEHASIGFILIDTSFMIKVHNDLVNRFISEAYGGVLKSGQNLLDQIPLERKDTAREKYVAAFAGESSSYEALYPQPDGTQLSLKVDVNPVCNESTVIIGACITVENVTSRKKAEDLYRVLFESSTDAISLIRPPEWHFVSANNAALQLYGVPDLATLASMHPGQLSPKFQSNGLRSEQGAKERIAHTLEHGSSFFEWEHMRPDGHIYPCSIQLTRCEDAAGVFIQATVRNITVRRQREQALAEAQRQYFELIHTLPVALYSCNTDGQIQLFNQAAVELWGRAPRVGVDLWCGSWHIFNTDGTELPLADCPMAVALRSGEQVRGREIIVKRQDGTMLNVMPHPTPTLNEKGEITGAVNMLLDITQRRKDEKEIRLTTERLQQAQEVAHLGHWELNFRTGVSIWSAETCRIHGLDPTDTIQSFDTWKSFIHPDDHDEVMAKVEKAQASYADMTVNHRILLKDGTVKHVHGISKYQFEGSGARPVGMYGISLDVTAIKTTEDELRNTLENMEQLVQTRTEKLREVSGRFERMNEEFMSSVRYADRIHRVIFPQKEVMERYFEELFIFNRPLQTIGGDFYWCHRFLNQTIIVCADCSGHGVPGAIMSIMGSNLLTSIIIDQANRQPALILELLDTELANRFNLKGEDKVPDGMDMVICVIDSKQKSIQFAGAMNPVVLVNAKETKVLKGSRYSIGAYLESSKKSFVTTEFNYEPGDMLYMMSDGFADQFGGPDNKRFMSKRIEQLVSAIYMLSAEKQFASCESTFNDWKGEMPQIDDVLLMGMRLG